MKKRKLEHFSIHSDIFFHVSPIIWGIVMQARVAAKKRSLQSEKSICK